MNKKISFLVLLSICSMTSVGQAYITVPVEPVANHFALADCVVVGKIASIAEKPEQGVLYPGMPSTTDFTAVEVETSEILGGPKENKRVKLAILTKRHPTLEVGAEGLFFGVQTPDRKFMLVPNGGFHDAKKGAYKKDLEQARRCAKLLEKPDESLASKNGSDRLLTAYILVLRDTYNQIRKTGPGVRLKAEPMDIERSKKIMLTLAEGDWEDKDSGANAGSALNWLRSPPLVTPKDFPSGSVASENKEAITKIRAWLKENAESHRLQRLTLVEIPKK